MVTTMLEAHVAPNKWDELKKTYEMATQQLPPQMVQTFLLQSTSDTTLWRAVSIWKSREALEEYRRSVATPGGVLLFRGVGAEPALSIFEVAAQAPADSP